MCRQNANSGSNDNSVVYDEWIIHCEWKPRLIQPTQGKWMIKRRHQMGLIQSKSWIEISNTTLTHVHTSNIHRVTHRDDLYWRLHCVFCPEFSNMNERLFGLESYCVPEKFLLYNSPAIRSFFLSATTTATLLRMIRMTHACQHATQLT